MFAWEPGIIGFDLFTTARSTSVKVPHWFPVLLFATLATLPLTRLRWKYSLRTLLIATTLVAVVFGLAVVSLRCDRGGPNTSNGITTQLEAMVELRLRVGDNRDSLAGVPSVLRTSSPFKLSRPGF